MQTYITPTGIVKMKYENNTKESQSKPTKYTKKERKTFTLNKSKVKKKAWLYALCHESQKNLYFLTITFPEKTTDENAYKMMNSWLTNLRQRKIIGSYIWVAERQKNGTIHFHFLINQYIRVQTANSAMRSCLRTLYKKDNSLIDKELISKYNGVHLSKNKNGKVANLAKSKNKRKTIINYITKYITKNDTTFFNQVSCCSREVSAMKLKQIIDSTESDYFISKWAIKAHQQNCYFETEWAYIIAFTEIPDDYIFKEYIYQQNVNYEKVRAKKNGQEVNYELCFSSASQIGATRN